MAIIVVCEFCGARYRFRKNATGQTVTCEQCGNLLGVSDPANGELHAQRNPDASALVAANGAPTRAQPATCPSCLIDVPADVVFCGSCGADVRGGRLPPLTRRWRDTPIDIDPPKDPHRPAVSDSMHKVGLGLRMILWDVVLSAAVAITLRFGPLMLPDLIPNPAMLFRLLASLQILWVIVMISGITGRGLCLLIPQESEAKWIIFGSVALESFAVVVNMTYFFMPVEAWIYAAATMCSLLANVLFLLFLVRLAIYLGRSDLAADARKSFRVGMAFTLAAGLSVFARFFFPMGALMFTVGSVLIGPFLFFPYVILLNRFCSEFLQPE